MTNCVLNDIASFVDQGRFLDIIIGSFGGIMVSIAAFQAVDPGSIPGRRRILFVLSALLLTPLKTLGCSG